MASTYVTFTLNLGEAPIAVRRHCTHTDGSTTWRVEADHSGAIYLQGSIEQLRAFAQSLLAAVATETEAIWRD